MKGFLKFVLTVSALFAAAVGVLVLADQIINKNRIRGSYLECDTEEKFAMRKLLLTKFLPFFAPPKALLLPAA